MSDTMVIGVGEEFDADVSGPGFVSKPQSPTHSSASVFIAISSHLQGRNCFQQARGDPELIAKDLDFSLVYLRSKWLSHHHTGPGGFETLSVLETQPKLINPKHLGAWPRSCIPKHWSC